ncbi:FkbM family methyltransferase [Longitalea luteola]|uniref:FkbM family methyltransferase n=1 Tax=Longitalea luteola TaxID=2812563 RepID=UPI001A96A87A|nr:FkbM family methyltransferase [Longitalea luteola]
MKKIIKGFVNFFGVDIVRFNRNSKQPEKLHGNDEIDYFSEARKFEWLKKYNFKTIIDVGANEGQFTRKISIVFPDAEIHCFEPLQEDFNKLKYNFQDSSKIKIYNFGLGDTNEEKNIYRNEYSPSSSLLEMLELHKSNFQYAVKAEPEKVSIRIFDEVFKGDLARPLLVKVDVQGYEMHVLNGGPKIMEQADVCIIETSFYPLYNGQPLFGEIYNYFIQRGYEYVGSIDQLTAPTDNKILQADAVFVRQKVD